MEINRYAIRHGKGDGALFLCTCCNYCLSTKDFDRENGNVRTQAAAAMNLHYDSEHKVSLQFMAPTQQAGVERVWRRW